MITRREGANGSKTVRTFDGRSCALFVEDGYDWFSQSGTRLVSYPQVEQNVFLPLDEGMRLTDKYCLTTACCLPPTREHVPWEINSETADMYGHFRERLRQMAVSAGSIPINSDNYYRDMKNLLK